MRCLSSRALMWSLMADYVNFSSVLSVAIKQVNSENDDYSDDYAPNFEEVDGAYWFRVVRACVHPFVKKRAC